MRKEIKELSTEEESKEGQRETEAVVVKDTSKGTRSNILMMYSKDGEAADPLLKAGFSQMLGGGRGAGCWRWIRSWLLRI